MNQDEPNWIPVGGSLAQAVAYDGEMLWVRFKRDQAVCGYKVEESVFKELLGAADKGKFIRSRLFGLPFTKR